MSDDGAHSSVGIDLSQFFQVFFDEAGENLQAMEQMLLVLDISAADDEALNAIFRCAHSVKGGAATFGFTDVAELTHQMEALLDQLRRHALPPTARMVDLLLAAGDALKALLACHQGRSGPAPDTRDLQQTLRALCAGQPAHGAGAAPPAAPASVPATPASRSATPPAALPAALPTASSSALSAALSADIQRVLVLTVAALDDPGAADSLAELFNEIAGLGRIEPLDAGRAADGVRRFRITTSSSDSDLLDLFTFHVPRDAVRLAPIGPDDGLHDGAPGAPPAPAGPADDADADAGRAQGYGFFSGAPGAPDAPAPGAGPAGSGPAGGPGRARPDAPRAEARPGAAPDAATLRVSVDKVDQLINLVGELVITQAMLAQNSQHPGAGQPAQMNAGLADLARHTRDLQEAVMSIRMIPMAMVFNRFPRMLRDLAARLGKQVELVMVGESTELDKGMVEKITDPLTHLVRNSCDHGIELPAERRANGKPAHGTLTLLASHQGSSIVIEVRDDGRGLSRTRLIGKAREKGLDAPDSMTDSEVWGLIFAPGLSTADALTDVSGRGVGMDVVKKNISALGGSVEIDSAEGYGMSVKVRLPLTLAIMDGMSVGVADEVYILPLGSVVESFQAQPGMARTIAGQGAVVAVRGDYLPVVDLEKVFAVPRSGAQPVGSILVVVESDGSRVALRVDALLGQQQVVVKNLEANYRKVPDVSGATLLGDGRVALILDVSSLVRGGRR